MIPTPPDLADPESLLLHFKSHSILIQCSKMNVKRGFRIVSEKRRSLLNGAEAARTRMQRGFVE